MAEQSLDLVEINPTLHQSGRERMAQVMEPEIRNARPKFNSVRGWYYLAYKCSSLPITERTKTLKPIPMVLIAKITKSSQNFYSEPFISK